MKRELSDRQRWLIGLLVLLLFLLAGVLGDPSIFGPQAAVLDSVRI